MKTKNYNQAFDELIKCLLKNTKEAKCVTALKFLVNEYKGDANLKEIVVTEYAKFLGFWFPYLRETLKTSKKMQNYLLTKRFLNPNGWFDKIWDLKYEKTDKNRMYQIISHTQAIVKALIQTQRRKLGFDQNSTKY